MLISTRYKYAIWALTYMSSQQKEIYKAKEISEATGLPHHFLSQILRKLTEDDLLISVKGKGGGFRFEGQSQDYTLYEIYKLVDDHNGDLSSCIFCVGNCDLKKSCPFAAMSDPLIESYKNRLMNITIQDLVDAIESSDFVWCNNHI